MDDGVAHSRKVMSYAVGWTLTAEFVLLINNILF